jgi:hypothetical protein
MNATATQQQAREIAIEMAIEDGRTRLRNARDLFVRWAAQMDQYLSQYDSDKVARTPMEKSRILNAAMNDAIHILPNLRLDLLADTQAKLERLNG